MNNRIPDLLRERGIKVAAFARETGIPAPTLYNIMKKPKVDDLSVSIFIRIAEGLGMTAEELYADARQTALNGYFESMNEGGKDTLVASARLMAGSPDVRVEKNNREDLPLQAAMGA